MKSAGEFGIQSPKTFIPEFFDHFRSKLQVPQCPTPIKSALFTFKLDRLPSNLDYVTIFQLTTRTC